MSAGLGLGAAAWAWISSQPALWITIAALLTFTAGIWAWNGVSWARNQKRPPSARISFDYSYGLALDSIQLGMDDTKEDAAFQIGLNLRNATSGALKYHVEEFDVILNNRTIANPIFTNKGTVIPRDSRPVFYYPPFDKRTLQELRPRAEGILKYTILYGHPESAYVRKAKKRLRLSVRLDHSPGVAYVIESESDEGLF